jgi:hypothetical protein
MKLIICAVLLSLAACRWEGKLKFNEQNTFTILQLTDLHFGESETKGYPLFHFRYENHGGSIQNDLIGEA